MKVRVKAELNILFIECLLSECGFSRRRCVVFHHVLPIAFPPLSHAVFLLIRVRFKN